MNLKTNKGVLKIDKSKEIARGGEGIVYELDSDFVVKMYHDGIPPLTKEKFRFLSSLDPNYFVSPCELVFNDKGLVVGHTMQHIDSTFFPLSSTYSKKFCKNNGIDGALKIKIAEKLVSAVRYAHKENIVIGDLNPFNILVNNSGVVKFIDTDSYQTPGSIHSDRLLEEIRDFYYNGEVSKRSDYFSLSVLIFNMFAFLHPFKGMHPVHKKIADRMINKLPIFQGSEIKIPKCYEPIKDKNFMNQFKGMYLNGERNIFDIKGLVANVFANTDIPKPSSIKKYNRGDLNITIIKDDEKIVNIDFTDNLGVVESENNFYIYDSSNVGYLSLKRTISKSDFDRVYVGSDNIVAKKGVDLFFLNGNDEIKLDNIQFPDKYIISKKDNIIVIITEGSMLTVNIDKISIAAKTIQSEWTGVYGRSFTNSNGLIYNAGARKNILFNTGSNVAMSQSPVDIKEIHQVGSFGMVKYIDGNKIKNKMFKIDNLKMKLSNSDFDEINHFAFIPQFDGEGTILSPGDNVINLIRTNDFEKIGEMSCDLISSQTVLFKSKSGIISWEDNVVSLLNKK